MKFAKRFLLVLLLSGATRNALTVFNKTYLKNSSHGTQPFIELAGWARARRKAELKENNQPGVSIQATGFWSRTSRPRELAEYFSGVPRSKMNYGSSYAASTRDMVDLEAEAMVKNAYQYNLRYTDNSGTDAADIFSMVSGQTTQDHILRDFDNPNLPYEFPSDTNPELTFATNLDKLSAAYLDAYQSTGSVFTALAISRYNDLLNKFRKDPNNFPSGTISLNPEQTAFGVRFNVYMNLPKAFFLRINAPVLKVKNNLFVKFSDARDKMAKYLTGAYSVAYDKDPTPKSATFYDEGTDHTNYYSYRNGTTNQTSNKSDIQSVLGSALAFNVNPYRTIDGFLGTTEQNKNAQAPLKFCKLSQTELSTEFGFGDICITFGVPVLEAKNYDLSLLASIIFGTHKAKGEFLFEPVRGNGGHFGFSFGLEGSADLGKVYGVDFDMFFHSQTGYLFKAKEIRTLGAFFDDTSRTPWNQYYLVGKLGEKGELNPLANLTTKEVDVRPGMFAKAVVGASGKISCATIDFGWGLSGCEAETIDLGSINFTDNTYAFADPFDYRSYEEFTLEGGANFSPSNNSAINKSFLDISSAQTPAQIINSFWLCLGYLGDEDPTSLNVGFAYNYCHDNSAPRSWEFFLKASYSF